jgi:hypothetical protein
MFTNHGISQKSRENGDHKWWSYACCLDSPEYFIHRYCWIEDKTQETWIPFHLWRGQALTIERVHQENLVIILKARQLGLTWLLVCYSLWMMTFRPGSGILVFSRRDDEASEILERIRGVHARLPTFLKGTITTSNAHELHFGENQSWARSFPTTKHSGRMYTATMAIIDEADFIQWLKRLMNAVKPTVDAGGKLVLISTIDKENRNSEFKKIWNQAVKKINHYSPIFLPWSVRPDRNLAWYRQMKTDYDEDDLFQEYPSSPEEALSARRSSKRFNPIWISSCRGYRTPVETDLALPGFTCFVPPIIRGNYLVSSDPAEGNPTSDPSTACVIDIETWEQVAVLYGRFEPDIFADYLLQLGEYYNQAMVCVERNNHGHAVILALEITGYGNLYLSPFDHKVGWLSTLKSKVLAVDNTAQLLRDGSITINDEGTIGELTIFEAASLSAPAGETDDLAMALINGFAAMRWSSFVEDRGEGISEVVINSDPLERLNF